MKDVEGKCGLCGKDIIPGHVGLCVPCFKEKYHFTPTNEGPDF